MQVSKCNGRWTGVLASWPELPYPWIGRAEGKSIYPTSESLEGHVFQPGLSSIGYRDSIPMNNILGASQNDCYFSLDPFIRDQAEISAIIGKIVLAEQK